MRFVWFLVVCCLSVPQVAVAAPKRHKGALAHALPVAVNRVIDGDTLEVTAQTWLDTMTTAVVRVAGIDTPELRTKCAQEKALALRAKHTLEALVSAQNHRLVLHDIRRGTYAGRVIARVMTEDGANIADTLISQGLARSYDGKQKRAPWC
ncbi:MAG: thermonuclease family protein [Alphaproteobacteria bacterium GM202ARS2]|nr:thermonuclease family protein [Alphaproteobacteria bacterium GM202ARS2]